MEDVPVRGVVTLGQFLKLAGVASTGGHAKAIIAEGEALVNGEVELHRGHKLSPGDVVEVGERSYRVTAAG